jgi:hypothetical protein
MQFDTHVCLVSAQAAPNLLPLLDAQLKPRAVILVVTPQMADRAKWLEATIRPLGIQVQQLPLQNPDNFDSIQEVLLNVLAEHEGESIALNVTGGTKWMAIAAQQVFRDNGAAVFYVDIDTDRVMMPEGDHQPHTLHQQIRLKQYLQAYGYNTTGDNAAAGLTELHKDLCQILVGKVDEWELALGLLNKLASEAEDKNTLRIDSGDAKYWPEGFNALLKECEHANVLSTQGGKDMRFTSDTNRAFANGGWLEHYVNSTLNTLRNEKLLQDRSYLNVEIVNQHSQTKNELDIAFMARNRLHVVECKTRRMQGAGNSGKNNTTDALYKLDSVTELAGLATRSMLVSYRKLNRADRQRATDLRIKVVEGADIRVLKRKLQEWIKG